MWNIDSRIALKHIIHIPDGLDPDLVMLIVDPWKPVGLTTNVSHIDFSGSTLCNFGSEPEPAIACFDDTQRRHLEISKREKINSFLYLIRT